MAIKIIPEGGNLAEEAGDILLAARSLADNIVVFPGKRPAHFLRKYLADKRGGALRAPRILSMDGFIDLAAEELGISGGEASALDQAGVLYGRLKKESCRVIAREPDELTLDAFLPWALKLTGDFEELKIELKTQKDLSGWDSILPEDLRSGSFIKKLEGFSRLYAEFYEELEKENLLTRSVKYSGVAAKIGGFGHERYENIVFAGFFALTAAEKVILKHLAACGAHILLQSGPGLEEQFSFLSLPTACARLSAPDLHFYKASDMHGEIFKLAQILKDPAPGDVIVLPEARALFPLIENVLPQAGGYNISMGYPLTATPVYALLDALGDLLDKKGEAGFFVPGYLKLVFHPYVKNIYLNGSSEPGRVIFQTAAEHLYSRLSKYIALDEIENDALLAQEAAGRLKDYGGESGPEDIKAHIAGIHKALIAPFEEIRDIADFAGKLLQLISYISANSTAPLHPYWAPFMEKAVERITELSASRLAGESFGSAAGYFKIFKIFMQGASYPFPGTPLKGLQVLGFLETRGLRFRRVYFLDANSDILPAASKEDTVLPHFVRESLGLSTCRTRERISRYYFSVLLAGASEAHIFYKDSSGQERSPFVEKLIWDLEREQKKPDESEVHLRINFSRTEPGAVQKTPAMISALKRREFSPSALDTHLSCGLRFYYRYVLRLSEKNTISEDIEQRDIGIVVHEILADFFSARKGAPLAISEKDYRLVLKDAGRVFDARLKGHNSGFEYLIKRQVERRLKDILDYHRDKLSGIIVQECETELKAEISTRHGVIRLKGRADRVDLRGAVTHILDYKTGTQAAVPNWQKFDLGIREDWPATLKSTQLPFYILAYLAAHEEVGVSCMDASLMLLGRENIEEEGLYKERYNKAPDKAAVFGVYREAIRTLIEEILDKDQPFSPPPDEKSCSLCSFKNLCGRQWVQ